MQITGFSTMKVCPKCSSWFSNKTKSVLDRLNLMMYNLKAFLKTGSILMVFGILAQGSSRKIN